VLLRWTSETISYVGSVDNFRMLRNKRMFVVMVLMFARKISAPRAIDKWREFSSFFYLKYLESPIFHYFSKEVERVRIAHGKFSIYSWSQRYLQAHVSSRRAVGISKSVMDLLSTNYVGDINGTTKQVNDLLSCRFLRLTRMYWGIKLTLTVACDPECRGCFQHPPTPAIDNSTSKVRWTMVRAVINEQPSSTEIREIAEEALDFLERSSIAFVCSCRAMTRYHLGKYIDTTYAWDSNGWLDMTAT
jgi:hypothetical protein